MRRACSPHMPELRRSPDLPQAGTLDTLIDSLPGWPDNIVRASDGNFWLCLVASDSPLVSAVRLDISRAGRRAGAGASMES